MQKPSSSSSDSFTSPPTESIHYKFIDLPTDFPLACIAHTQTASNTHRLHFHNGLEIGYCLQGTGLFFVENRILPFQSGDVTFIFANQPHIARSSNEQPSYWYFMTVDVERLLMSWNTTVYRHIFDQDVRHINCIRGADHKDISQLVLTLFQELQQAQTHHQDVVRGYMYALLVKWYAMLEKHKEEWEIDMPAYGYGGNYQSILPAVNAITIHYAENLLISDLAGMCHLSESQFRRVFYKVMGCLPMEYLSNIRMNMASSLLISTQMPITRIANQVGYPSISCFNRFFKGQYGVSPTVYREREQAIRGMQEENNHI